MEVSTHFVVGRDRPRVARSRTLGVSAGIAAVLAISLYLRLHVGSDFVLRAVDDIGQCVAAALAAVVCARRAATLGGRARAGWTLISVALTCWAAGEVVWSYFELWQGRDTPFPSLADAGYLLFPVFALAGLLVLPSPAYSGTGRFRVVLDGGMVASALFIVSWQTALGNVYRAGGSTVFDFTVSLAYPVSDLVLTTTAVMIMIHARVRRSGVVLVAGMAAMAVADSGFTYLTSMNRYQTGSFVDVAWFAAFLLIAVSAVYYESPVAERQQAVESLALTSVPYVLVLGAAAVLTVGFVRTGPNSVTLVVAGFALTALVVRQFLTTLDNRRLTNSLLAKQEELSHRAFHDPLTGLANRALFFDRLEHALDLHRRDRRPLTVLFCDLDDFKSINDSLGHGAGDLVLQIVAMRLRDVTRTSDTLARLGGDEFAMLLEGEHDAAGSDERIRRALATPMQIGDHELCVQASIGRAALGDTSDIDVGDAIDSVNVEDLLREADVAMYQAKRSRKAQLGVGVLAGLDAGLDAGLEHVLGA